MDNNTPRAAFKGLDVGTSRIVLAQPKQQNYHYEELLNAFVSLPYSKMTEVMLRREGIFYEVEGSEIFAHGNRVEEFANLLNGDTRRPMRAGLLNPAETKSVQMMELALRRVCGEGQNGEKICFSVPCGSPSNESDVIFHERTISQILENLGYQTKSLNEGLAVIFAELEKSSFTGIGISFGGGMCNVCLAYLGLPVLTFSTPRAGDHIDHSASSVTAQTPATIRLYKEENFAFNGRPAHSLDRALSVYYNDMVRDVVDGLKKAFAETRKLPKFESPVAVAVSGGSAKVKGFRLLLEEAIRKADLPIRISEVRLADDPLNTTAKGTLMAAMLDM